MSREEVAAALRNVQVSLDGLQRVVEAAIAALPETRRDALPEALAGVRRKLAAFAQEAVAELDAFAEEAGLQLPDGPATSGADAHGSSVAACASPAGQGMPLAFGGVQLRSLERRVASMGGIPALGACVLPKMTPGQRPQLAATASPAAVEIMRGRMGDSDATPLRRVGGDEEESAAPTPLVALRSTPAAAPKGGLGASPGGGAPPGSELAAAIARRMQRLGSASPEKDSAAAPPAAAAAEVSCDG